MLSYAEKLGLALLSASMLATLKLTIEVALLAPTPWLVTDSGTDIAGQYHPAYNTLVQGDNAVSVKKLPLEPESIYPPIV